MKRNIMCIVSLFVTLSILICGCVITTDAKSTFYDSATSVAVKNHIEADAGFSKYATAQGSCTDGEYAYFAVNNGSTTILKYNVKNFELEDKKSGISLGHANDMTYNPKTKQIIVANNAPDYNIISFVDPDTLSVTATKKIKQKIYSIAYNEKRDVYVVGLSGTYNFALLDNKFKLIKKYKGTKTAYTRQGADCDDDYIYFAQSGSGGNLLMIYDYSGNEVACVKLNKAYEIENVFHIDNQFFVTLHYYGNFVYRIGISKDTAIKYDITFDANGADGQMDDMTVTYSKDKKLSKCTFTKEGYHFGGWILKRDAYNTYYGKSSAYGESKWLKNDSIVQYSLYGDNTKVSKTTPLGNVTAKAFWIADEYRIYYDNNGGQGYMPLKTVGYDEKVSLDASTLYKNGYVFSGWSATRQVDNKTYGYAKGQNTPKWLNEKELEKPYIFKDGETITKLTYDLGVTFYAYWEEAFELDSTGTKLIDYSGYDSDVTFPKDSEQITQIADFAFADSKYMKTITIPENIDTVGEYAFSNCDNLEQIYFEEAMPKNVALSAFDLSSHPRCYLVKDGNPLLIGWYFDKNSYTHMYNLCQTYFS